MSRVGKLPVAIPDGVTVEHADRMITVKGKKGELTLALTGAVNVAVKDGAVQVDPANDSKESRAMWGTTRANINNMMQGVTEGFSKTLEVNGVGYRSAVQNNVITLSLGFSHEVKYVLPEGVEAKVDKQTTLMLSGYDKQKVGQVAAEIRALRKPEPYKGKGVRSQGEYVRMKEGTKK